MSRAEAEREPERLAARGVHERDRRLRELARADLVHRAEVREEADRLEVAEVPAREAERRRGDAVGLEGEDAERGVVVIQVWRDSLDEDVAPLGLEFLAFEPEVVQVVS